jgi:hypothetical protein
MGKKIISNLFDTPHANYQEVGLSAQLTQQFISTLRGDVFFKKISLALNKEKVGMDTFLLKLKSYFDDARIIMPQMAGCACITGNYKTDPVFVWVNISTYEDVIKFEASITGSLIATNEVIAQISDDFDQDKLPVIKWWWSGRHGEETKDFYLQKENLQILPEYYPDLGDPEKFIDDYVASNEAILLIAGPPGTGKTTLLRHMISKYKLCAHVIYDEKLMEKDVPFQTFLFGSEGYTPSTEQEVIAQSNVMIIEDADLILTSRERDGNKLMSRFLNISDGLIKLPNKKLVFTTNITDFSNVDQALMRPGRCFGVLATRALTFSEAQAAAIAAKMPVPTEDKAYMLAEIFNQGKQTISRSIGFGVRH